MDQYFWLRNNLRRKVNRYGYVTVYCFLGTCDLTLKKRVEYTKSQNRRIRRNYVDLRHSSDAAAVIYIQDQIRKYLAFVSQFPTVKIVFLKIQITLSRNVINILEMKIMQLSEKMISA